MTNYRKLASWLSEHDVEIAELLDLPIDTSEQRSKFALVIGELLIRRGTIEICASQHKFLTDEEISQAVAVGKLFAKSVENGTIFDTPS